MRRLKPFSYFEPLTLPEASKTLVEQGAHAYALAGGTDLLVRMKRGHIKPTALINLKRVEGLGEIKRETGKGIHIGAAVLISTVEHSPLIRAHFPVLTQAAGLVGAPAIRNLATLGGNIGRASPASDMAAPLIALGARLAICGPQGNKELKAEEIFCGPGKTTLSLGELVTSFFLPEPALRSGAVYLKLGRRQGMDCAIVGVAAHLALSSKKTEAKEARIALASVAPVPLRAKNAEEVLLSGSLTGERLREAARAAAENSSPITDMRASASYRREMVRVITFRALQQALNLAQEGKIAN